MTILPPFSKKQTLYLLLGGRNGSLNEMQQKMLKRVAVNIRQVLVLANNFLDVARIEGVPGQGTSFHVHLPLHAPQMPDDRPPRKTEGNLCGIGQDRRESRDKRQVTLDPRL